MFNKKGITLIALVITIIVLLILIGVTIAIVIGPDGVIFKAQEAKIASRYNALQDEITQRRVDVELALKAGIPIPESDDDFLERLIEQDLIDLTEDEYNFDTFTLYVGKAKYPKSNYVIDGSTVLGGLFIDQSLLSTLLDTNVPANKHLKNMILIMKPVSINEPVKIPISNTNGLEINWDYKKDSGNFEVLNYDLDVYPSHLYTEVKEYEVHIRGESAPGTIFGRYEDEDEGLDFYVNDSIIGLKSWGENGFTEFKSFGGRVKGSVPSPTRNTFIETQRISAPFSWCSELEGPIPENLFANCPHITSLDGFFALCAQLSGTIPSRLFLNCPNVKSFELFFLACGSLTGTIPGNLFDSCTEVESMYFTFGGCNGLTGIGAGLFSKNLNITNFRYTFNTCTGLTGNAPILWDRTNVQDSALCFVDCTNLSNYDDIPDDWK